MRYSLCTISFRHELVSFEHLIEYAHRTGFSGIELWGVHARALVHTFHSQIEPWMVKLKSYGMQIPMISDYVGLLDNLQPSSAIQMKLKEWIELACRFETSHIRIFAGHMGSSQVDDEQWELCIDRLRKLSEELSENGLTLVLETHPNTLADTLDSTLRILREVDHPALRINLDFLHIWEGGSDPIEAYQALKPWVSHFHMKNVTNPEQLSIFHPHNVYSPSGPREGMVPLKEGIVDFERIVAYLSDDDVDSCASLEWFGKEPFQYLSGEMEWLRNVSNRPTRYEVSG
ncbi:sugar phosphate isomerase/epimerase family protein [Marinicrinis lubricantis]|uniref:Sugar phosphate isomerase/epimerase family protein n=1 Tax=Marinicrinis lubricantis TaxID=2086470 RepID=A0ABW1IRU1_9BACL